MQTMARVLLLAALFVPTAALQASPIDKVLQLIGDLQAKVVSEGESAQKLYAEFAEWCEDRSKELGYEIKTGKAEVDTLKASIAEERALSESLNTKIEELVGSIASDEADLKAATEIRTKENTDFAAEEKELSEIIDLLTRASQILSREMAKGGSLLQAKNVDSVAEAVAVMLQASVIGQADAAKLSAFVQQSAEDSDLGAPAASVYEGHAGNIVDTLESLLEKAETQLSDARKKETTNKHNFEMLKQSLEDEIKFADKDMSEAKGSLGASGEKKAKAAGDLEVTSKDLGEDVTTKADLHQQCMTKAEDFEAETKSRGEELKALAEAKKVISETSDGADAKVYGLAQASFLQTRRLASSADLAGYEVVRLVRDLAHKHNAPALAQLAQRLDAVARAGAASGADPFAKIKGLISDMVAKLEGEADADATHKAYCDKQLSETEAKKAEKDDEVKKLSTKIDQQAAQSAQLKEEVAELQAALAALTKSQAEMDKLRAEESEAHKKNKATLELGLVGVKKALAILTEYYAKGEKAHTAAEGAGSSIIGLLEVCESDFSKDLAEVESTEETAAAAYEQESKENEVELTMKTQDVKYKTKEAASLDKSSGELSSDRTTVQAELDAILEYDAKIKEECIAKAEPYAERKGRREAEIAGLKEALTVLENETALVQKSVRHTLRGAKH